VLGLDQAPWTRGDNSATTETTRFGTCVSTLVYVGGYGSTHASDATGPYAIKGIK
jgi:hypothetical protein